MSVWRSMQYFPIASYVALTNAHSRLNQSWCCQGRLWDPAPGLWSKSLKIHRMAHQKDQMYWAYLEGLIRTRLGRFGQLGRIRCLQKLQEQSVCRWFHAKDICFQSDVPSQKQLGCSRILDQHAFDKELPRTLSHTHILFTHCHTLTYCSHTLTYSHTVRTLSHTHILFAHCHILTYCTF